MLYSEKVMDHFRNPRNLGKMDDADGIGEVGNAKCGDIMKMYIKVKDGIIEDGAFTGDGCAISQASADIMLGMIIGKTTEEALKMGKLFLKMIKGDAAEEEIDSLEEASALKDIAHMPARVKCAVLGWHTLEEMMKEEMKP